MDERIWADIVQTWEIFAPMIVLLVTILVCSKVADLLEDKRED